jgi:glycine/sarcosine N-methyltransferase
MYDSFSSDYDRFVNWTGRLSYEMPFIERFVKSSTGSDEPARVLDAACGTGMHAIALAQHGFIAAGADLSEGMIERARANAAEAGKKVNFQAAGFSQLSETFDTARQPFDTLLCLGNSLPHLLTSQDQHDALADFAACLRPGGLLLIQNRNFDSVLARRERWMDPQTHREDDQEWLFLRFYDYEADGLINFNIITLHRQGAEEWKQHVHSTLLYPLRLAELTAALQSAGFDQISAFGSLAGDLFDVENSGNLVIIARNK